MPLLVQLHDMSFKSVIIFCQILSFSQHQKKGEYYIVNSFFLVKD